MLEGLLRGSPAVHDPAGYPVRRLHMTEGQTTVVRDNVKRPVSLRQFFRREDGHTAIEFAIVGSPFLLLAVAMLHGAVIFLASQILEIGAAEAARLILTGQAQNEGMTKSTFANAVCTKVPALFNCNKLMIDVQTANSFASANVSAPGLTYKEGQVTNTWQYNPGNPGDIVVVRVMYLWPLAGLFATPGANGDRLMMATAAFKNEPYVTSP
jgi:Flp pilus assembly protein TadG